MSAMSGSMRGAMRNARPRKRKAPITPAQLASGDQTPRLSSGQMTPAASYTTAAAQAGTETRFRDFTGLSEELLRNIPFENCTEVQAATLPSIIANRDVLAQAKTGTGKTLAFLVPSIQRLINGAAPSQAHTSILVLSPTRELAQQIGEAAKGLLGNSKFGVQSVVGGTNISTDVKNLKNRRADILVATPGRLVDLLENYGLQPRFSQLSTLVLDEADRLLDQGFRRELLKILEALPNRSAVPRQTLLFSATLPAEVHSISSIALNPDHEFISTLKEEDINAHEHVIQETLVVPASDIVAATVEVLRREESLSSDRGGFKVMAFLPTARAAGLHHDIFSALPINFPVWEIHSRMSQSKRTKATDEFRAAAKGVLFSSDVTARGIDVQGVTAVVQIGLPSSGEQYVHRLGRTARGGAAGHGVLILADFEKFFLNDKTMKTFTLHPYPALDPSSLQQAHSALDSALANVSEESKAQAYQAWIGYYNSSLKKMGWSTTDLVRNANEYAHNVLRTASDGSQWQPPAIKAQTIGKMGLKGVQGLNILRGDGGSGRGGARGSGGQSQGQRGGRGEGQGQGQAPRGGLQGRIDQPLRPQNDGPGPHRNERGRGRGGFGGRGGGGGGGGGGRGRGAAGRGRGGGHGSAEAGGGGTGGW